MRNFTEPQTFGLLKKENKEQKKISAIAEILILFIVGRFSPVGFENTTLVAVVDGDKYIR